MLSPYDCHNEERNEADDAKSTSQNNDGIHCSDGVTTTIVKVNSGTAWSTNTAQLNKIRVTIQLDSHRGSVSRAVRSAY